MNNLPMFNEPEKAFIMEFIGRRGNASNQH